MEILSLTNYTFLGCALANFLQPRFLSFLIAY